MLKIVTTAVTKHLPDRLAIFRINLAKQAKIAYNIGYQILAIFY